MDVHDVADVSASEVSYRHYRILDPARLYSVGTRLMVLSLNRSSRTHFRGRIVIAETEIERLHELDRVVRDILVQSKVDRRPDAYGVEDNPTGTTDPASDHEPATEAPRPSPASYWDLGSP